MCAPIAKEVRSLSAGHFSVMVDSEVDEPGEENSSPASLSKMITTVEELWQFSDQVAAMTTSGSLFDSSTFDDSK